MPLETLYAVTHLRFAGEGRHREVQQKISEHWFGSLPAAKARFQKMHNAPIEFSFDPKGESHKRDSKRIYKLELDAKAKSLSARKPRYDAERLAHELKLDATAGRLLVQEPPKQAVAG